MAIRYSVMGLVGVATAMAWAAMGTAATVADMCRRIRPTRRPIPRIRRPREPGIYDDTAPLAEPAVAAAPAGDAADFATQGEVEFNAGRYAEATQAWRHALLDDPQNGDLMLLVSQAMFQTGQFEESVRRLGDGPVAIA